MSDSEKQKRFLELFEPCRESLVKFSKAMTRDSEATKDLVQETILRAFDKFETINSPVAFKSFLFSVASRIYKRQVWRSKLFSRIHSEDEYEYRLELMISNDSKTDSQYDIYALQKALLKLPKKQRESVVLFEIIGLSVAEIQEIQGGSVSGVKSRVQRARKELARLLGAREYFEESHETEISSENEQNDYGYTLLTNNVYLSK